VKDCGAEGIFAGSTDCTHCIGENKEGIMRLLKKTIIMTGLAGLFALVAWIPLEAEADEGFIRRLTADFFNFDNTESFTNITAVAGPDENTPGDPDGEVIFKKKVKVPGGDNTLYVSIYTTGDTHGGSALWLSCRVDGAFCRPGAAGAAGAPSGWISLLKLPQDVQEPNASINCNDGGGGTADCHDNSITYQWCIPVEKKEGKEEQEVELRMATSKPGELVFIEAAHVYIDSSRIRGPNQCTQAPPLETHNPPPYNG
jgi:hypothetical protein